MAYFSNGTEGLIYQDRYCDKCRHYKLDKASDTYGCPVWDIHSLYNGDYHKNEDIKNILDILIPRKKHGFADKCNMFSKG